MTRLAITEEQRTDFNRMTRVMLTGGNAGGPVRYRHRGRSLKGVDCIGLPMYLLTQIGVDGEDVDGYSAIPDGELLRESLRERLGEPISPWEARPGDIPLMRWYETKERNWLNHVGILTRLPYAVPNPKHPLERFALLHSFKEPANTGRVMEHRIDAKWCRRIVEVYSLTGGVA